MRHAGWNQSTSYGSEMYSDQFTFGSEDSHRGPRGHSVHQAVLRTGNPELTVTAPSPQPQMKEYQSQKKSAGCSSMYAFQCGTSNSSNPPAR